MDPSILRETSQEVHDEYVKRFDKLPAFAPCDNKAAPAPPQKTVPPQEAAAGSLADKPQTADSSEANRQSGETAAGPLPEPPQQQQRSEQQAGEKLQPAAVAQRDKPEDETEKDNTKIDQILAAMKNSSAVKMDIPQIDLGQEGITFIESDVDEYNVTLFCGAVALMSNRDEYRDTRYICVGSLCSRDPSMQIIAFQEFQVVLAPQAVCVIKEFEDMLWLSRSYKFRDRCMKSTPGSTSVLERKARLAAHRRVPLLPVPPS